MLSAAGAAGLEPEALAITPGPTGLAHPLPFADLAVAAHGAIALSAAAFQAERTGDAAPTAGVDRRAASLSLAANTFLHVDGAKPDSWDPLTGYYQAADGWLYVHANFPHLRDGLLRLFEAPADREALAAQVARWRAADAEAAAGEAGLCAIAWATPEAWATHPQRAALRAQPVTALSPGAVGQAREPASGPAPLSGVRVLDLTRVIAGPMASRALAEHGADVLRIAAPHLPFIEPLVIDTGFGKRSTHLDLRTPEDRARFDALLAEADVVISSYRPGALAGLGYDQARLERVRPGLVTVSISAFGTVGPWAGRRGYDTYVQAATGLAGAPEGGTPPTKLPCQPLDYLTGALGAFSAIEGLRRRHASGTAWRADLALARTADWIWDSVDPDSDRALPREPSPPAVNEALGPGDPLMRDLASVFGRISALAPPRSLGGALAPWRGAPVPLGTDAPVWLS